MASNVIVKGDCGHFVSDVSSRRHTLIEKVVIHHTDGARKEDQKREVVLCKLCESNL